MNADLGLSYLAKSGEEIQHHGDIVLNGFLGDALSGRSDPRTSIGCLLGESA